MDRLIANVLVLNPPALRRLALVMLILGVTTASAADISYTYDALGRVTGVTISEGSAIGYTLDAAGNRTRAELAKEPPGADGDADGIMDLLDLCPSVSDPLQLDYDGDGAGDPCDSDDDNDGVDDASDAFPIDPSEWLDNDGDGVGDNADMDDDNDGVADDAPDNCPFDANPDQADMDANGVGDACDLCLLCLPSFSGWRLILLEDVPVDAVSIDAGASDSVAGETSEPGMTGISPDIGTEE